MSAPVDHPSPLCPSCTARMEQAVASGKVGIVICGDCQSREAARLKAEWHPPPWTWSEPHGRETVLWDAAGNVVLAYGNDSTIVVASPHVREVVRAAPELERLLRWAATTVDAYGCDEGYWPRAASVDPMDATKKVDPDEMIITARALLARLEAAKAGG